MYDLIIIGGSAAAVAAGIYSARRNLKFTILTSDIGGEVATSGEIENYPGIPHTNGIELTEKFKEHLNSYNVKPEEGICVASLEKNGDRFVVGAMKGACKMAAERMQPGTLGKNEKSNEKIYEARAVIIATGVRPRELNVPGEGALRNKGVSYCTVCDGPLFGGKDVAIVGGGNSANEAGIMLSTIAKKVYVLTKNAEMKGDTVLINKLKTLSNVTIVPNAATTKVIGERMVAGLEYKDSISNELKNLDVQGIFVHIGMLPNSQFVPSDVKKNQFGEIEINAACETNVPGIFAAGDVTNVLYKQISIAVGQGAMAALRAVDYLNKL